MIAYLDNYCRNRPQTDLRSPEDYTSWHKHHFDNVEPVREPGESIKVFAKSERLSEEAQV